MLGKLIKYEFKATARLFLPLYLALIVFALINRYIRPLRMLEPPAFFIDLQAILSLLSIIVYFALIVGVIAMTVFIMIQRFYKSLLGDEGYLMFTLPVDTWKHIVSKLVVAMWWTMLSFFVTVCSILIISGATDIHEALLEFFNVFRQIFGISGYFILPGYSLLALVSSILMIYAAIALGHLFSKHKLIASFAMYLVLYSVSQVITIIIMVPFMIAFMPHLEEMNTAMLTAQQINYVLLVFLLPVVILTAGYFLLTNMVLKKKLNLE